MKCKVLLFLVTIFSTNLFSQTLDNEIKTVNWKTFEEVGKLFDTTQRPVLVYLYANYSDSCKLMFDSTFTNQEVVSYLNAVFYNIKLDVASDKPITFFDGKTYNKQPNKLYHDIVNTLIGENISLPAILMFNKDAQGEVFWGYKDRDHIFPVLIYYNEEIYKSTTYPIFEENYFKAYPVGMKQIITKLNIKWNSFSEMLELQKVTPKKILIDIYFNYSIAATMMRTKTYNDPIIANYLNNNFYATTVDARTEDLITIKGVTYKNPGAAHGFHEFPIAVLNGKMSFPAFIILDEDFNLIDRVQAYLTPEDIEPILNYYGGNFYKTMTYENYKLIFKSSFTPKK